ncbi:MAG TPA: hypothetical protein VEQ17_15070 [Steroidobacteraceae bacterium]|nr:hypothetical protein [Steroidobacteraceae bacterium]
MKKRLIMGLAIVAALMLLGRLAGDPHYWRRYWLAVSDAAPDRMARAILPRLVIPGAPEGQPVATPETEAMAPQALEQAGDLARKRHARALIVHRHGHRVLETYAAGTSAGTSVTGGELAPAMVALALGPLVDTRRLAPAAAVQSLRDYVSENNPVGWRNPWSAAARQRFSLRTPPQWLLEIADGSLVQTIAQRVWQPLHARDAQVWGSGEDQLRLDCCVIAQLGDWMRIGDLLLQQGSLEGERLASPDWIRAMLAPEESGRYRPAWLREQAPWSGAEPPAARDASWFDLGAGLRLWLIPRRGLAILYWTDPDDGARDTELPNLVIRGLTDQAPPVSGASPLEQIVPGH